MAKRIIAIESYRGQSETRVDFYSDVPGTRRIDRIIVRDAQVYREVVAWCKAHDVTHFRITRE